MRLEFSGDVFRWTAREQEWFFVSLPEDLSSEIREIPRPPRGFGSVRVDARIADSVWRTSIFPGVSNGAYVLPLKRSVRDAQGLAEGDLVRVAIEVLDG